MPEIDESDLAKILADNPELSVDEKKSQYQLRGHPLPVLAPLLEKQSEQSLLDWILGEAKRTGWKRAHFRASRTKTGWRTAVSGDGAGFPDLLLLRKRLGKRKKRFVVAECKSETGRLSPQQYEWLELFGAVGAEVYCFTPRDKDIILEILKQ